MNFASTTATAILPTAMIANPTQTAVAAKSARVAILCDFAEENWPSMDLVGEMLATHLDREQFSARKLSPPFQRRFTRIRLANQTVNADRVFNRFWDYQRWLRPQLSDFDLFHVVDHSYSQLVHSLPAHKTIVSCHDLDTFRCLIAPEAEPRSRMFRKMMEHVLSGLQKAARVTCDSMAIRDELLTHKLVEPDRLRVIPLGVHPTCSPEPDPIADAAAAELIGGEPDTINLLHVGSTIRRKRIDVLLKVLAKVLREFPKAKLLRVGDAFTRDQLRLINELNLTNSIRVLPHVSREVLAAIYRRADLVLQPSDAEGFGLPVIEAMACGTPVIASDLPVLREVAGRAAAYAPVADLDAWTEAVGCMLYERLQEPEKWSARRTAGLTRAAEFSWSKFAAGIGDLYREVLAQNVAKTAHKPLNFRQNLTQARRKERLKNSSSLKGHNAVILKLQKLNKTMSVPAAFLTNSAPTATVHRPRLVTQDKLHVLQLGKFYPPHPGGMESHLEALCKELKEKIDLQVIVAASNSLRSSEELIDGVKVAHLGRLFTLRSAPMCPTMVRWIRASKADLVHIHWPNPTALLAYLTSGHRGRLVFTYHSDVVRQKVLTQFFDPVLRRGLDRADAIIVSSANYMNTSEVLRPYREKCRVVPFGIDVERFERPDELEAVRLRKQFGPRMILSVGRLVYYKGFEFLIDAMKSIDGHLVLVGNGPMEAELRNRIRTCGVENRVTLLTQVKDVAPFYHAAQLFVLPSVARSEAFGVVQLEAMACAMPVVNTRVDSGVPFVSVDGVTGITVSPADSKALAEAINSLLDDPRRRAAYGKAAWQRVKNEFTLASMAEQTMAVYREVMNSDVRPSFRRETIAR